MKKILVAISGYYERFQINTIESCIKRAKYPENISFAIAHHEDHLVEKIELVDILFLKAIKREYKKQNIFYVQ